MKAAVCPGCKATQHGLVMVDGELYATRDDQTGVRVLGYVCPYCGRRVHHPVREGTKLKPHKLKMPTR